MRFGSPTSASSAAHFVLLRQLLAFGDSLMLRAEHRQLGDVKAEL